jgi:hypothetical protein
MQSITIKRIIVLLVIIAAIIYPAASFLFWSFDPRTWGEFPRFLCLFALIAGSFLFAEIEVINKKEKS